MKKKEFKHLIILFFLSVISFFSNIWVREADLMEQRNFITAREMIKNKSYFVTTLNGNLRFEKPPFPTWITGIVMKIFNNFSDEWILRIPSVLTGILLIFLIYYFVKYFTKNLNIAFFSSFVSLSMFMLIKISNENTWDIYTYVFSFASVLTFYRGLTSEKIKYFIFTSIFHSISIMSKGPVGIYGLFIPFLIAYIYTFGIEKFKKTWKYILLMLFIEIFLSSIWPIAMYIKYPKYFIEILSKEENTWNTKHTKSFFFYLDYFIYTGIWIFFSIVTWIKNSKNYTTNKYNKFLLIWNFLVVLFLSLIQMKKKRYGLPIYIISSLNIGLLCNYYSSNLWNKLKNWEQKFIYFQNGFIIFIAFALSILFFIESVVKKKLSIIYSNISIFIYLIIILLVIFNLKKKKKYLGKFTIFISGIFMLIVNSNANWIIDKNFINKEKVITETYLNSKSLRKNPPTLDIYSENYDIHDVWDAGKEIKTLYSENLLPNNFIILGNVPSNLKQNYIIAKNEVYLEKSGKLLNLYYLNKKER